MFSKCKMTLENWATNGSKNVITVYQLHLYSPIHTSKHYKPIPHVIKLGNFSNSMLGWGWRTWFAWGNINSLLMFISVDGLTAEPNWIAVLSARITVGPIYAFSAHLFTHLQRHSKWRLMLPLMEMTGWTFQTSYCIKAWGEGEPVDKSEKQKAEKEKQSEVGSARMESVENTVNQAADFSEKDFSCLSPVEREYNCWLLLLFFSGNH